MSYSTNKLLVFSTLSLLLCLASCYLLINPNPRDVTTEILNYGEGSAKVLSEHKDENVPAGKRFTTDYKLGISKTSDSIKIEKGVQFGIEYIIETPKTGLIEVKTIWNYPDTISNNRRKKFIKSEYIISKVTNEYTYSSYEINEEFEMIAGDWILQLFYQEKLILHKKFMLTNNDK